MGRSLDPVRSVTGLMYSLKNPETPKQISSEYRLCLQMDWFLKLWSFKNIQPFLFEFEETIEQTVGVGEKNKPYQPRVLPLSCSLIKQSLEFRMHNVTIQPLLFEFETVWYIVYSPEPFIKWMKINRRFKSEYTWWNLMFLAWILIEIFS